jgi:hypothetical protein
MGEPFAQRHGEHSQEERERSYLRVLRRSLEIGACVVLRNNLEELGPCLERSTSPEIVEQLIEIRSEAEKAFEIERIHGVGSLLNLDHPSISKQVERDNQFSVRVIPLEHVEAARRYRGMSSHA